jgi:hypothetical protein
VDLSGWFVGRCCVVDGVIVEAGNEQKMNCCAALTEFESRPYAA